MRISIFFMNAVLTFCLIKWRKRILTPDESYLKLRHSKNIFKCIPLAVKYLIHLEILFILTYLNRNYLNEQRSFILIFTFFLFLLAIFLNFIFTFFFIGNWNFIQMRYIRYVIFCIYRSTSFLISVWILAVFCTMKMFPRWLHFRL